MHTYVAGLLSFLVAFSIVLKAFSHTFLHGHPSSDNHHTLLAPPASFREPAASPRNHRARGVVRRLVLRFPFPSTIGDISCPAIARNLARAILHAALLSATHTIGNFDQPLSLSLKNWALTTIYILITTPETPPVTLADAASDPLEIQYDPYDWSISFDIESNAQGILPPQATHPPSRRVSSPDHRRVDSDPSKGPFNARPRRCRTAP